MTKVKWNLIDIKVYERWAKELEIDDFDESSYKDALSKHEFYAKEILEHLFNFGNDGEMRELEEYKGDNKITPDEWKKYSKNLRDFWEIGEFYCDERYRFRNGNISKTEMEMFINSTNTKLDQFVENLNN